ncbi:MAG: hypothetical protein J6J64_02830 [Alistipes sp.]|nr:hypothetical protein [Alistipes sp.]
MENVQNTWSTVTQSIYKAVLIYVWAGIASSIIGAIGSASDAAELVSGDLEGAVSFGFMDVLGLIASLAVIAGYVLFYIGLNKWREIADTNDAQAINKLRIAALLTMISSVVVYIPVVGTITGAILSIVALILMLMGYSALKSSTTLPEGARVGAGKLYTAQILSIIAVVVVWIPVLGWIAGPILSLIAFFKMLKGWKTIANS